MSEVEALRARLLVCAKEFIKGINEKTTNDIDHEYISMGKLIDDLKEKELECHIEGARS